MLNSTILVGDLSHGLDLEPQWLCKPLSFPPFHLLRFYFLPCSLLIGQIPFSSKISLLFLFSYFSSFYHFFGCLVIGGEFIYELIMI
jgi:hypothetical protein